MGLVFVNPAPPFPAVLERLGGVVSGVRFFAIAFRSDQGVLGLAAHDLDVPAQEHRLDVGVVEVHADAVVAHLKHPIAHGAFAAEDIERLLGEVVRPRPNQLDRVEPHGCALGTDRQRRGGARGGEAHRVGDPVVTLRDGVDQADSTFDTVGNHATEHKLGVTAVGAGGKTEPVILPDGGRQVAPDGATRRHFLGVDADVVDGPPPAVVALMIPRDHRGLGSLGIIESKGDRLVVGGRRVRCQLQQHHRGAAIEGNKHLAPLRLLPPTRVVGDVQRSRRHARDVDRRGG